MPTCLSQLCPFGCPWTSGHCLACRDHRRAHLAASGLAAWAPGAREGEADRDGEESELFCSHRHRVLADSTWPSHRPSFANPLPGRGSLPVTWAWHAAQATRPDEKLECPCRLGRPGPVPSSGWVSCGPSRLTALGAQSPRSSHWVHPALGCWASSPLRVAPWPQVQMGVVVRLGNKCATLLQR